MLKQVTLTGIDNRTDIDALVELQKEFPFAEFGVLISKNQTDQNKNNRYPRSSIFDRLRGKGLHLSCHICGSAARDIIQQNDWIEFNELLEENVNLFDRFQLNVSGVKEFDKEIYFPPQMKFIIQIREESYSIFSAYKHLPNILGFHDNSGGKGIYSGKWMVVGAEDYFGYAGGISEDNVVSVINDISKINYNNYWIDMESSVRTDDWFDIEKCRRILSLCKPIIAEQEAQHKAELIVFASMTRPDIEEACRMRGIKVAKSRMAMEGKLVAAIKDEILKRSAPKPTPTTF